jgi:hypothetical protein
VATSAGLDLKTNPHMLRHARGYVLASSSRHHKHAGCNDDAHKKSQGLIHNPSPLFSPAE